MPFPDFAGQDAKIVLFLSERDYFCRISDNFTVDIEIIDVSLQIESCYLVIDNQNLLAKGMY